VTDGRLGDLEGNLKQNKKGCQLLRVEWSVVVGGVL